MKQDTLLRGSTAITVQYEMATTRRGQMVTTVKERTFPSPTALERFCQQHGGNVRILRFLQKVELIDATEMQYDPKADNIGYSPDDHEEH